MHATGECRFSSYFEYFQARSTEGKGKYKRYKDSGQVRLANFFRILDPHHFHSEVFSFGNFFF